MKRRIRRLTAVCLALLVLTTVGSAAFSDVPEGHWAQENIERSQSLGIFTGVGGGKFGLGASMTRAAYATALCRVMGWELTAPEKGSFADNQDTEKWYYSAVETALANGAVTREADNFRPTDPITREEMAVMTVRAFGYNLLAGTVAMDCPFTDVSVAQGYITLAYRMGLITGVNRLTFNPKSTATREQAATILLRAYDRLHTQVTTREVQVASTSTKLAEGIVGEGSFPVSPRAPMEAVYAAAVAAKGGSVTLDTAALAQTVKSGEVIDTRTLSDEELAALLADETVQHGRSARHGSSYLRYADSSGDTVVVWYESADDIAEKVELCRLLGVSEICLLRPVTAEQEQSETTEAVSPDE